MEKVTNLGTHKEIKERNEKRKERELERSWGEIASKIGLKHLEDIAKAYEIIKTNNPKIQMMVQSNNESRHPEYLEIEKVRSYAIDGKEYQFPVFKSHHPYFEYVLYCPVPNELGNRLGKGNIELYYREKEKSEPFWF